MMEQKCILVMVLSTSTDITQVNLSTPFDPSSGTSTYNLDTESISKRYTMDLAFDDDGTRLYLSESNTSGSYKLYVCLEIV